MAERLQPVLAAVRARPDLRVDLRIARAVDELLANAATFSRSDLHDALQRNARQAGVPMDIGSYDQRQALDALCLRQVLTVRGGEYRLGTQDLVSATSTVADNRPMDLADCPPHSDACPPHSDAQPPCAEAPCAPSAEREDVDATPREPGTFRSDVHVDKDCDGDEDGAEETDDRPSAPSTSTATASPSVVAKAAEWLTGAWGPWCKDVLAVLVEASGPMATSDLSRRVPNGSSNPLGRLNRMWTLGMIRPGPKTIARTGRPATQWIVTELGRQLVDGHAPPPPVPDEHAEPLPDVSTDAPGGDDRPAPRRPGDSGLVDVHLLGHVVWRRVRVAPSKLIGGGLSVVTPEGIWVGDVGSAGVHSISPTSGERELIPRWEHEMLLKRAEERTAAAEAALEGLRLGASS